MALVVSFVKNKNELLVKELDCETQRPVNRNVSSEMFHQNVVEKSYFLFFLFNRNTCRFDDYAQTQLRKNKTKQTLVLCQ